MSIKLRMNPDMSARTSLLFMLLHHLHTCDAHTHTRKQTLKSSPGHFGSIRKLRFFRFTFISFVVVSAPTVSEGKNAFHFLEIYQRRASFFLGLNFYFIFLLSDKRTNAKHTNTAEQFSKIHVPLKIKRTQSCVFKEQLFFLLRTQ